MNRRMRSQLASHSPWEASNPNATISLGSEVLSMGSAALLAMSQSLDDSFVQAVQSILACKGHIVTSGIGKAGLIAQKISATLSSTGTPSFYLHPSDAVHGDLGRVRDDDWILMLSHSGETEEVRKILPALRQQSHGLIGVTSNPTSCLAKASDIAILLPALQEAGPLGLAPSTSTTVMVALGDALALAVSHLRGFRADDFAQYHPGGSLGRQLGSVEELMRPLTECRVAERSSSIRDILVQVSRAGRRSGAIMLVDSLGKLCGIFTDSDLARLLERRFDHQLDQPMEQVMSKRFHAVRLGARSQDAIDLLAQRKISELPVVDDHDIPKGMIDITDILGLVQHAIIQNTASKVLAHNDPSSVSSFIRIFQDQ